MGDSAEKQKRPSFFKGAINIEAIRSGCCNISCSGCDYCGSGLFYPVRRKLLNIIIERG